MNSKQTTTIVSLLVIVLIIIAAYFMMNRNSSTEFTFMCKDNKSIVATFYKDDSHVDLGLSDGRKISLNHAASASGARYTNADESIVFWNKGTTAFITEGLNTTFADCDTQATTTATSTTSTTGSTTTGTEVTAVVGTDGLHGYTNATYGFSIRFPEGVQARNDFSTFSNLPSSWRLYPQLANQGAAVASFIIFRQDQGSVATGKAYPLFYDAEVRIGVSPDVAKCYTPDAGYTNQTVTNVVINGVTFKKFSTSDAATMKYVQAESYRTVHNNKCYVLEQIRSGSTYRDETMTAGMSQALLDTYYNVGATIIKTFKFTK